MFLLQPFRQQPHQRSVVNACASLLAPVRGLASQPPLSLPSTTPPKETTRSVVPPKWNGASLSRYLTKALGLPVPLVQRLARKKLLRVASNSSPDNHASSSRTVRALAGRTVATGDTIEILDTGIAIDDVDARATQDALNRPRISPALASETRAWIVHEDDVCIAINKPTGLPVHGGSHGSKRESLTDRLGALVSDDAELPRLVHRIDKGTSGIVLLAKDRVAAEKLSALFRDGSVTKEYLAIVAGTVSPPSGRVLCDLYRSTNDTRTDERTSVATTANPASANAKIEAAETGYRVLDATGAAVSLVMFTPATGRKHQLRTVAENVLGTPIVGDYKYGFRDGRIREAPRGGRLMLHLYRMSWGKGSDKVQICAPIPNEMRVVGEQLGVRWGKIQAEEPPQSSSSSSSSSS
ncbi:pseudouridine synthase [Blastocladiella britannica]|nr:pseudouridine synthase [Blastocladiella britannica]